MAKLSDLTGDRTGEVTVEIPGGGEVQVVYRPNVLTTEWLEVFEAAETVDEVAARYSELLVSWDLTVDDEILPIDESSLRKIPLEFLRDIMQEITQGNRQGRRRSQGSRRG